MSLTESLRSLLRALNIHEKEIFKIASDNLFTLNFINTQFDSAREDPIVELETEERMREEQQAQQDEEEKEEEIGAMDVDGEDGGEWTAAWKDDDDEMVGGGMDSMESFLDQGASHFADISQPTEEKKSTKKSTKRSRSKK